MFVTTGWQIDPFGHSSTNAALLRADFRNYREQTMSREFNWHASWPHPQTNRLFTGILLTNHVQQAGSTKRQRPRSAALSRGVQTVACATSPASASTTAANAAEQLQSMIATLMRTRCGRKPLFAWRVATSSKSCA